MLDREDELRLLPLRKALRERPKAEPPIAALHRHIRGLREEKQPFLRIEARTVHWWRVVAASPALMARMRELGDQAADGLAIELAGPRPDGVVRLAADLIVLTVRTARDAALRERERVRGGSAKKANATFLMLMERGLLAIQEMLESGKGDPDG